LRAAAKSTTRRCAGVAGAGAGAGTGAGAGAGGGGAQGLAGGRAAVAQATAARRGGA